MTLAVTLLHTYFSIRLFLPLYDLLSSIALCTWEGKAVGDLLALQYSDHREMERGMGFLYFSENIFFPDFWKSSKTLE